MSERLMKIDKGHLAYRRFYVKFVDRTTQLAISEFPCALFQSEPKCKTILMKMNLICMKMKLNAKLIFI